MRNAKIGIADIVIILYIKSMLETLILIYAAYLAISTIFFIFPSILWGTKTYKNSLFTKILTSDKVLSIAHRGGPRHLTENTMEAFEHAVKYSNCIEMDVCETADNILVVHHDHHLKRTCGLDKNVQDYKFEELPLFSDEVVLDFGYRCKVKTNKEKIPKLVDVFAKFPNTMMNIELKTPTDTALLEFVKLVHDYERIENTVIGIRNKRNLELKQKNPQIKTFFNDKKAYTLMAAYFVGLAPFLPIQEDSLQIPIYSKQYEEWNVDRTVQKDKWKIRLYMRAMNAINVLMRPLMWHLKRRGIITMGWVCNSNQAFDKAVRSGVKGIMTDDPVLLHQYLKERGLLIQNL